MHDQPGDIDRRRELYDATAGIYSATFPLIWRIGFRGLHTWVRSELDVADHILDAGAGSGYWSRYIAGIRKGRLVIALDFSAAYIARARDFVPPELGVRLIQADLTKTPFPDGVFDAVLCSGVLDTMPDPATALAEVRRILRDDGKLLLILRGNGAFLSMALEKAFRLGITAAGFLRRPGERVRPESHLWSRRPFRPRLDALAKEAGLRVADESLGRVVTRVVLEADPDSTVTASKHR